MLYTYDDGEIFCISIPTFSVRLRSKATVRLQSKKLCTFQDVVLLRSDHRGVLHGEVPGHLPPTLLPHHVRVQEGREDNRPGLDDLAGGRHSLLPLHGAQLYRQAAALGILPKRVRVLRHAKLPRGQ